MQNIYAHSLSERPESEWEPLSHHLTAVGGTASKFAEVFGYADFARAMGLLHDIGKMSAAYQDYIRRSPDKKGPKGPDHSSAGAQEALRLYGDGLGKLMAYGLAGHHAGLADGSGHSESTLVGRLKKTLEAYDGWEAHVTDLPDAEMGRNIGPPLENSICKHFHTAFLARMLFSCLVDADFLETEAFYAKARGDRPPVRGGVVTHKHLNAIREHMAKMRRTDSELNRLRADILDHANAKAVMPPGLFTLTVPTGGGKTLASLSFALEHAMHHELRRIIYVIPFTSIIEQTADVFRHALGTSEDILEHHSNFDWDQQKPPVDDEDEEGRAGLEKLRRDEENWDAPIIVTTSVQFFESLFASRTSRSRKLHNLAGSVIVLDEVQSLPVKLLRPCLAVMEELANNYGASLVLCTATQPALRRQDEALPQSLDMKNRNIREGLDIPDERELAPDPEGLYEMLKRVEVEWPPQPVSDAEIAARFETQPQMLCIVNSRKHARDLYECISHMGGAVHLTTLMCGKHRRVVLEKIREDLKAQKPVRLVATSLIEAGVDVDFPEVWREATGLSSIAQAAGRCNREGKLEGRLGRTVVFEAKDHRVPPVIESFYGPARQVLRRRSHDLLSLSAISEYFDELYFQQKYEALDEATLEGQPYRIVESIRNSKALDFPFSSIASAFRMIDDVMEPVIIPLDDAARHMVDQLRHTEFPPSGIQRRLQQYVVPVPAKTRAGLLATGAVQAIRPEVYGDRFIVLVDEGPGKRSSLYSMELGLRIDDPTFRDGERNIF